MSPKRRFDAVWSSIVTAAISLLRSSRYSTRNLRLQIDELASDSSRCRNVAHRSRSNIFLPYRVLSVGPKSERLEISFR